MSKPLKSLIRNSIKQHRKAKGLSAYKINLTVKRAHPYAARIENNSNQPNVDDFAKICILLGMTTAEDIAQLLQLDIAPVLQSIKKYKKD